jgi:ribosomal protein L40E
MHYFYEIGVKVDDYLYKLPGSIKNFERKGFFFGGIIISIILLISASIIIEVVTGGTRENVGFNTTVVAIFIIIIIVILGLIGIFLSKRGKINAWMGVFFVGVASYSIYLMISIVYTITSDGNSTSTSIPLGIALYFINFLILLNVIGGLIGTKTTVLKQKLRIFSTDTILMWLIFSVTSYEFASLGLENIEVELFRYIVVYVLFIPFLFILGLYGIIHYNKIMGKRKMQQLEIEAKKEGVIEINQVICKQCGAVNQKEAHYCTSCGKELK